MRATFHIKFSDRVLMVRETTQFDLFQLRKTIQILGYSPYNEFMLQYSIRVKVLCFNNMLQHPALAIQSIN